MMTSASRMISSALVLLGLLGLSSSRIVAQSIKQEAVWGIANFTWVDRNTAIGGVVAYGAVAELKRRGFVSIINVRFPNETDKVVIGDLLVGEQAVQGEEEAARTAGLKFFNIPFRAGAPESHKNIEEFIRVVSDPANQPVYIHSHDVHRGSGMWLMKRLVADGWPADKALAEADAIGVSKISRDFALEYAKKRAR